MSILKHSASDWCCFKKDYDPLAYYRKLKEIGFAGVEMVPPERQAAARAAGLELLNMVGPGMQKGLNRREDHAGILAELRKAIDQAAEDKIGQVVIFSGNRNGLSDEDGIRNCVAGIKQVIKAAEKAGVTLLFEVLNTYDHKDYHACHGAFAFSVAKAVGSPHLRVLYDIYHMQRMGEDVIGSIRQNLACIGHLHIAGSPKRDFPGQKQAIDYAQVVLQVHAMGYRGYWGHEYKTGADSLRELAQAYALLESYAEKEQA